MADGSRYCVRTLRLKVKREGYAWLDAAATEVNQVWNYSIGDVSSLKLVKTRMAKSVLDAGWGMLKTQLQYKGEDAGRCVRIVNERYTTQECSSCKALIGPAGLDSLVVRSWTCSGCGSIHDRDVNAAINVLFAGRCSPSVSGNEPSLSAQPPGPTSSRRKARIRALKAEA